MARTGEVAQQVKVLGTKLEELSSIPGPHMVRENQSMQVSSDLH